MKGIYERLHMLKKTNEIIIYILLGIGSTIFCILIALITICNLHILDRRLGWIWLLYGVCMYYISRKILRKECTAKSRLPLLSLLSSFSFTIFLLINRTIAVLSEITYEYHSRYSYDSHSGLASLGNWDEFYFIEFLFVNLLVLFLAWLMHMFFLMDKNQAKKDIPCKKDT